MKKSVVGLAWTLLAVGGTSTKAHLPVQQKVADFGRCIAYLPESSSVGRLFPQQTAGIIEWNTTCWSSFSGRVSGGATGRLEKRINGRWQSVQTGYALFVAHIGPGTYRFIVINNASIDLNYSAVHKRGMG